MNPKIWIEPTGSTLRLVWYYQGKRQRLSLRVPDNASGRAFAAIKIAKISMDMVSEIGRASCRERVLMPV